MGIMTNSWGWLPAPTQAGQVGGHEGVGKVVKAGPGVEKSGVKIGDRVGIKWLAGICESCEACRAGADASCFGGVCLLFPSLLHLHCHRICFSNEWACISGQRAYGGNGLV
jgi:threonine dehydrogenase-like Zn-dependent dehydrogenase